MSYHFTVLATREIRFSLLLYRIFSNRAQVLLSEDDCEKSENMTTNQITPTHLSARLFNKFDLTWGAKHVP